MKKTDEQRFMAKVAVDATGCWLWTGSKKARGYGNFSVPRPSIGKWGFCIAHRWSYERWVAEIPEGWEVDHLCRVPSCVNPDHLEAVTPAENKRRYSASVTHCPAGHDKAVVGVYDGNKCKECHKARQRAKNGDGTPHAEKTHCPAGHPYSGANLRVVKTKTGEGRRCRTCDNVRSQGQYEKRKAQAARLGAPVRTVTAHKST